MDLERYRRVDSLFLEALALDEDARAGFVRSACGADQALLQELEALLAADREAGDFLEAPPRIDAGTIAPVPAGTIIAHHRIVKRLGIGGMGDVYLARDTRLDRLVALKLLHPHLVERAEARKELIREARLTSVLEHPNICTVFEAGETDGHCYVSMQYIDGVTLDEKLQAADGPLDLREALSIALQIADAVEAAHDRGIIHRDITPGNVIIDGAGQVKVLDFGIAQRMAGPQVANGLGTPGYMSPEQAHGAGSDVRSDVYSLCAVLLRMATGGTMPDASAEDDDPGDLPESLVGLIAKGLQQAPENRPATMGELKGGLLEVQQRLIDGVGSGPRFGLARLGGPSIAAGLIVALSVFLWSARQPEIPWQSTRASDDPADTRSATTDAEALRSYLLGVSQVKMGTVEANRRALDHFMDAVGRDPGYAQAWAALADVDLAMQRAGIHGGPIGYARAETAARRALEIEPELSGPHLALALIAEGRDWNWRAAERHYRDALASNPDSPDAHRLYARHLAAMGRAQDAISVAERGVMLDRSSSASLANLGFVLFMAERYDDAADYLQTAIEMTPDSAEGYFLLGLVRSAERDYDDAVVMLGKAYALSERRRFGGVYGAALAKAGRTEEAEALLQQLSSKAAAGSVPSLELAVLLVGLGRSDDAMEWLERMVDRREWNVHVLKAAPELEALRDRPRYQSLLSAVGLDI